MGDEVYILVDGEVDVLLVLFRERGQVDVYTRHIHTLVSAQHTVVLHLGHEHRPHLLHDEHIQQSVVEEDMGTLAHTLGEIGIRHVDDVVGGVHLGATEYLYHVTLLVSYGLLHIGGTHLGALGINEQSQVGRHFTRVADDGTYSVGRGVGGIHTHHVHTGKKQLAQEVYLTPAVTYRAYYFGLFHLYWFYRLVFICFPPTLSDD